VHRPARYRAQLRRGVLRVPAVAARLRRRLASEGGFTLVELLMASVLGLLVVGIGATVFTAAVRSQPGQSARGSQIRDGRTMTERLVRELRQGEALDTGAGDGWSSQSLSFRTFVHSSSCGGAHADTSRVCRVTYTCTAGACTRVEADPQTGAAGPASREISGLATSNVFTYQTDPTAGCPAPTVSNEGVSITDAATLRNAGESPGRVCVALVFPS
jgi:Tfp pilus assembly protein PilW